MEIDKLQVPSITATVVQYHIVNLVVGSFKLQASLQVLSDKLIKRSVCKSVATVVKVLD